MQLFNMQRNLICRALTKEAGQAAVDSAAAVDVQGPAGNVQRAAGPQTEEVGE